MRRTLLTLALAAGIATTGTAYADDWTPTVPTATTTAADPTPGPSPTPSPSPFCGPLEQSTTDCNGLPTPRPTPAFDPERNSGQTYHLNVAGQPPGRLTMTVVPLTAGGAFEAPVLRFIADQWVNTYLAGINPTIITDTRPGRLAWRVIGQASAPRTVNGSMLPARHLGWTPALPVGTSMGTTPGVAVAPGFLNGGEGLGIARVLAEAPFGHGGDGGTSVTLGGSLVAWVPDNALGGDYGMTLTLTLIG